MRKLASVPVLVASLALFYAGTAAADDSDRRFAITATSVPAPLGDSDVRLLAERHLALYRASRDFHAAPKHAGNADASDRKEPTPSVVRTSATAALPLSAGDDNISQP